jgi:membrane-bound serine protease (ClpP class)
MSQEQLDKADDPGRWEKLELIDESAGGRYLQLSGRRAVALQLADANADSVNDLVRRYELAGPPPVLAWGWVDTTVMVLTHWLTSVLLIIIGLVALYVEFTSPGISIGGLIAGLCFVLFFWSHFMGGTAGWLEIILFLAGVVFLGVEIFVIPGTGVTGVIGIVLVIASLVLASQTFVVPTSGHDAKSLTYGLAVVFGALGGFIVAVMVFGRYMGSLPLFNRLILRPASADDVDLDDEIADEGDDAPPGKKGPREFGGMFLPGVGDYGVSDSPLRPSGKVRFGEEFVDVVTDGTFVEPGRQVRVIRVMGNQVVVREVEDGSG